MSEDQLEFEKISIRQVFQSIGRLSIGSASFLFGSVCAVVAFSYALGGGFNEGQRNKADVLMAMVAHYSAMTERLIDPSIDLTRFDQTLTIFNATLERVNARVDYADTGVELVKGEREGFVVFSDGTKADLPPALFLGGNGANPGNPSPPPIVE